jgi:hypothetical protein
LGAGLGGKGQVLESKAIGDHGSPAVGAKVNRGGGHGLMYRIPSHQLIA